MDAMGSVVAPFAGPAQQDVASTSRQYEGRAKTCGPGAHDQDFIGSHYRCTQVGSPLLWGSELTIRGERRAVVTNPVLLPGIPRC